MPLVRSAARRVTHKDEVSQLLVAKWRGRGDDLVVEMGDMHCSTGSYGYRLRR